MHIRHLRAWLVRLADLFSREKRERELAEELESHLQMHIEDNMRAGMSPQEARRQALIKLGGIEPTKERYRQQRGLPFIETLVQDLRFGMRRLAKSPGFTVVALLLLGLGIGANTAIFSVVNSVLLRPLPLKDPDRIVEVWEVNPLKGWTQANVAPANLQDWQEQNQVFEDMAAYMGSDTKEAGIRNFSLTGRGEPERVQAVGVSANFFSVLGVEPAHGRAFLPEENWEGSDLVVVLSSGLWQRRFGKDPEVVGQTIHLNGRPRTVVGVMPEGFDFPTKRADMWIPLGLNPKDIPGLRRPHFFKVIARLKEGVSIEQAQAEMNSIAARLEEQYPDTNTQMGVGLGSLQEFLVGETRPTLLVLLGAVAFVLLIACANVANLLLARAASREREIAIRSALGASRLRLVRQLLAESLMLSALGGALGVLIAVWGLDVLVSLAPQNIPRLNEVGLDSRALGFTVSVTFLTGLIFGLLPALQSSKPDLNETLKDGGRKGAGGLRSRRSLSALVVSEVALSLVLLIGAGLMIKSFVRLQQVDPGFDPENILSFKLSLPGVRYPKPENAITFYESLTERLRALPGVKAAGMSDHIALEGYAWTSDFTIEGRPPEEYGVEVRHKSIDPGYFETLGLSVLKGRNFTTAENRSGPGIIIINETLARQHFKDEDPIGKRIKFSKPERQSPWRTIVGVVSDEKQDGLDKPVRQEIYEPLFQNLRYSMTVVARTTGDPQGLIGAVRGEVQSLDKDLPIYDVSTMEQIIASSVTGKRFTMTLMMIFAAVAMVLAAVGLYGMMSYSVTQRTHEIGIRMALGARRADVLRLVIGQGMTLVGGGICLGLAVAFALTRLMENLLFGVSATDPAIFAIIAAVLVSVALLASYIPARRASKVDPLTALRYE
ncbi:MAG TPA: ABC transporter permease [Blastocatellia bacterium]|nr:ABC transporter permease [Blastocatellia bacterium]